MSADDLHDLLERAGERAPRLDPTAIARQARASAVRRHRRRVVAVPTIAVVAVVVAAGTVGQLNSRVQGEPGSDLTSSAPASPSDGLLYSPSPTGVAPSGFTCCTDADVQQAARPGSTFRVHWMQTGNGPGITVSIEATLTGPYTSVDQLKSGAKGKASYSSRPLQVSTAINPPPLSTIAIPANAVPGLYELETRMSTLSADGNESGGSGGASIITITK